MAREDIYLLRRYSSHDTTFTEKESIERASINDTLKSEKRQSCCQWRLIAGKSLRCAVPEVGL
jgi:hypothetical protein